YVEVESGPELTDVRLAERSDGAWLVWSSGANTLRVGRLDPSGAPTGGTFDLDVPYQAGSVAAASVNDFLMIGWIEDAPGGASLRVQVLGPDGVAHAGATVAPTGTPQGRLTLLGSPKSRSWVLAWSESAAGGDQ